MINSRSERFIMHATEAIIGELQAGPNKLTEAFIPPRVRTKATMACDMSDSRIAAAYEAIQHAASSTDWFVLGYRDSRDKLELYASGAAPTSELVRELESTRAQEVHFGLLRLENKLILFTYLPDDISGVKRARALVHSRAIATTFRAHQAVMTVHDLSNFDQIARSKLRLDGSTTPSMPLNGSPRFTSEREPSPRLANGEGRASPHFVAPMPAQATTPIVSVSSASPASTSQLPALPRSNDSSQRTSLEQSPLSPALGYASAQSVASKTTSPQPSDSPGTGSAVPRTPQMSASPTGRDFSLPRRTSASPRQIYSSPVLNGFGNDQLDRTAMIRKSSLRRDGPGKQYPQQPRSPSQRKLNDSMPAAIGVVGLGLGNGLESISLEDQRAREAERAEAEGLARARWDAEATERQRLDEAEQLRLQQDEMLRRRASERLHREEARRLRQAELDRQMEEARVAQEREENLRADSNREREEREAEASRMAQARQEQKRLAKQSAIEQVVKRARELREPASTILSGYVTAQPRNATLWKRRWFELKPAALLLFKDDAPTSKALETIPLSASNFRRILLDPEDIAIVNSFRLDLYDDPEPYLFYCDESDDRELLVLALKSVCGH
ncbi:uncharacterized protein L969DRAFT_44775 [Mixia osmundae IAM 14324]|uniref:PH domain-containing protein n=1 Tax=Mixia osmundae (strain CBS 9802 / IAM 14324 / JCM 22182 / KY 12970) TaxID=764103 RepID=G7DXZ9_MIXOS|nr:uncharacterized protein L969DRAFT_44775 [Mixia osmundae IAM 14324]KEI41359.1 hypothetical protein L969DRAFT_44775 [Mixia osmundae IAM 14324]GAA95459.1 hypothetical protein E5Q_02113 [Mixia osmundae IAM 14324]